ncbi:MAG: hypothetical protein IJJ26_07600 [Victivallales bacterium]|nr:hypothetical protein [Victivallales bacterium]
MKKCLLLWMLLALVLQGADVKIRSSRYANWYVLGEEVQFKPESAVTGGDVTVRLMDSAGQVIQERKLTAAQFSSEGWRWTSPQPGFYEVTFSQNGKVLEEVYQHRYSVLESGQRVIKYADIVIQKHPFAIAPAKTRPVAEISPNFGFSPHFGKLQNAIPVSRLIGARSLRLHYLGWPAIEPEKGKFKWDSVDAAVAKAKECGYSEADLVFNMYGTARWASTRPDKDEIHICVREYAAVMPKDISNWTNFLLQTAKRYPGVRRYELWNEQHFPGYSCFWLDTPEQWVELQKAGYTALKKHDPDLEIWIGGMARRYLEFYDYILKLGVGNYFDVMPLHGAWQDPRLFQALDKKHGLQPKRAAASEWHAMLMRALDPEWPSERMLLRNMTLDFLSMVKNGAGEIDMFCLINNVEREELPVMKSYRSPSQHCSGMFRWKPYLSPRYQALAWHVFTSRFKGWLQVGDGKFFSEKAFAAIPVSSEAGQLLLFWNNTEKPVALHAALAPFCKGARVYDPEGKEVTIDAKFRLAPDIYYTVVQPNPEAMKGWKGGDDVLVKGQEATVTLDRSVKGAIRDGALFDDQLREKDAGTLPWHKLVKEPYEKELPRTAMTTGRFAVGMNKQYFDLLAEVHDPVHFNDLEGAKMWGGDSLQFAIDTAGLGRNLDRVEIMAALGNNGKVTLFKSLSPQGGGDLPARYSPSGREVQYGKCDIQRKNGVTTYRVRVELSELFPFTGRQNDGTRFALLVNGNDGKGRTDLLRWGGGIAFEKQPSQFGTLYTFVNPGTILTTKDLSRHNWNNECQIIENDGKVVTVSPKKADPGVGVAAPFVRTKPRALYHLELEVRGACRLQVMVGGKGFPRKDLMPPTRLTDEWKKFSYDFVAPEGAEAFVPTVFTWKQPEAKFQVRNFVVSSPVLCQNAPEVSLEKPVIRSDHYANWYVLGEEMRFRPQKPIGGTNIKVRVLDSSEKLVREDTLSATAFSQDGWGWKSPQPGFFQIEFWRDGTLLADSYVSQGWDYTATPKKWDKETIEVGRHFVAVAPAKTLPANEISQHFGFSPHFSKSENTFAVARLVGCRSLRLHTIDWYAIEKEKGKFDWSKVDAALAKAKENGFSEANLVFNMYGTARWASTRPDKDQIHICVPEYAAVMPKNVDDWVNFLLQTAKRYPGVRRYELWNEQHFPGASCFWHDTPEEWVQLLKAGYTALKKHDPGLEIWIGGMGRRYLQFYDYILKLGAGDYFDVTPLHGGWQNPQDFTNFEKRNNVAPKKKTFSEWHAMLLRAMMQEWPSERMQARNMALDFLNAVSLGADEIDMFCLINNEERDSLPVMRKRREPSQHVSGLFRWRPYLAPRYQALAWHVFTARFRGQIHVKGGQAFAKGKISAQHVSSEKGDLVFFWNTSPDPIPIDPALAKVAGPNSIVTNGEGQTISLDKLVLDPEAFYTIANPTPMLLASWKATENLLKRTEKKMVLKDDWRGYLRNAPLFDDVWNIQSPNTLRWNSLKKERLDKQLPETATRGGRFAVGVSDKYLDVLAEIEDPVHIAPEYGAGTWIGDNIQFALDAVGDGRTANIVDVSVSKCQDGRTLIFKNMAAAIGGDIPTGWTAPSTAIEHARCDVQRVGEKTIYKARMNLSECYPFTSHSNAPLRFAFLANCNDGKGRADILRWADGIVDEKDPTLYGTLYTAVKTGVLADQAALKLSCWSTESSKIEKTADGVRVSKGTGKPGVGVSILGFSVSPRALYHLEFEARGLNANCPLQCLVGGNGFPRLDLLASTHLTPNWQRFSFEFTAPDTARSASVMIFCWNRPDAIFEVRNFQVTAPEATKMPK